MDINLEAELTSEFAKAAFRQLNSLGSRWTVHHGDPDNRFKPGEVYVSANVEIKDGPFLVSVGKGYAADFDTAVTQQLQAVKDAAANGEVIVVNAYRENRAEFTYNSKTDTFVPRKPPTP